MSVVKFKSWLAGLCVLALVGCGGGSGSDAGTPLLSDTGSGSGSGGGTTTAPLSLTVQLLDSAGAVTTAVVVGQPVRAQAVLKRNGQVVAGEIVQFMIDQAVQMVALDPISGSQLTDDQGRASVTVSSLGASAGAGRIEATATLGGATVIGAANFFASGSVGTQPATLTLSGLEIGSAAVSAYGTTGVRVRVLQSGVPYTSAVTVNFTSSCAAGKAAITPSAQTQPDGYAVATFVDNGCAQNADSAVTVTASIGSDTKSSSMTVKSPTSGSLRFVSVVPSDKSITLRGQGGNGRQENATLTFQLVDVSGNGVGNADVCFDATTYAGELNLDGFLPSSLPALPGSTKLCGSDALSVVRYVKRTGADGKVAIQINSGTVPTPVRVRARALYPSTAGVPLETYSDTLSISTGLPLQRSFSLSVDRANIDGGNFDGEVAKLTMRLADQFSNPVPDGTVVNFIASGAAVCTADNGSCKTTNGSCSCDLVSQARRPQDNRVVVTAYTVGLEDFTDSNGDNKYTAGESFSDLADAFVDANKDGKPSFAVGVNGTVITPLVSLTVNGDTDILVPYQQVNAYSRTGDGVRGTAHLRASTVIYLSQASSAGDPTVVLPLAQLSQERNLLDATGVAGSYFVRLTPICPEGSPVPQATLSMVLDDGIGNPMASGTTLVVADPSDNVAPASFRPSTVLAIGARPPSPLVDLPNTVKVAPWSVVGASGTVVTPHSVTVRGVQDKCTGTGSFALDVASPRGGKASARVLYDGEPRTVSRYAFPIRYVAPVFDLEITPSALTATITSANLVGRADVSKYSIDWGDGNAISVAALPISTPNISHTYAAAGSKTVILNLQRVAQTDVVFSTAAGGDVVIVDSALFSNLAASGRFTIDWGDSSTPATGTSKPLVPIKHSYSSAGRYTAKVFVDETVLSTSKVVIVPPLPVP